MGKMKDDLCVSCSADADVGTSWVHHVEEVGICGERAEVKSVQR